MTVNETKQERTVLEQAGATRGGKGEWFIGSTLMAKRGKDLWGIYYKMMTQDYSSRTYVSGQNTNGPFGAMLRKAIEMDLNFTISKQFFPDAK